MRFELSLHTYVEVFNRLVSVRFDPKDWMFKITKTSSTKIFYFGPVHIGYTNQITLKKRIEEMIASMDESLIKYQENESIGMSTSREPMGNNILH